MVELRVRAPEIDSRLCTQGAVAQMNVSEIAMSLRCQDLLLVGLLRFVWQRRQTQPGKRGAELERSGYDETTSRAIGGR